MQPFSPESIVETKRLNYEEISTEKCMAFCSLRGDIIEPKAKYGWNKGKN
jgi:hypothetical protein